jgi:hypothetical protein
MHTFHAFAPEVIDEYDGLSGAEYRERKEARADAIIDRLEKAAFPGLRDAIVFREVRVSCHCFPRSWWRVAVARGGGTWHVPR